MMSRVDLFGECNVDGNPIDVFTAECCMRCVNPECTRSSFGKSKFDLRVSTWHDRLFEKVPKMDPGDPRFQEIAAQKFMIINPALTVASSTGWVDPRDVEASQPSQVPTPEPQVAAMEAPAMAAASALEPKTSEPAALEPQTAPKPSQTPEPQPAPVKATGNLPKHLVLENTPAKRGQMLQPPVGTPQPKSAGSWDAPIPSTDTDGVKVVKSGARVKLGG